MPSYAFAAAAAALAPPEPGRRSARIFARGSLGLRWYAPCGTDPQTLHTRDELYAVAAGQGEFVHDGERSRFAAGDLLFAPAGAGRKHASDRFENVSDDFATWAIFYGPEGGEHG